VTYLLQVREWNGPQTCLWLPLTPSTAAASSTPLASATEPHALSRA
jgi:hypothetical protein